MPKAQEPAAGEPKRSSAGRVAELAVYFAATMSLLSATILLVLASPAADDFCRATIGDVATHFRNSYATQTGRWASVGLVAPAILSRIDLYWAYPVLLIGIWLSYVAAFTFFVLALSKTIRGATRTHWAAVLVLLSVWFGGLPAPGQTVYWFSGGLEYGVSFSALVMLIAYLATRYSHDTRPTPLGYLSIGLAVLFISGMHELVAVAGLAIFLAGFAINRVCFSRFHPVLGYLVLIAAVGLLISVAAPGNSVRAERLSESLGYHSIIRATYLQFSNLVIPWITDPRILAATIFLATDVRFRLLQPRFTTRGLAILQVGFPLLAVCLVLGTLFAAALMPGGTGPGRLNNLAYSWLVLGWFGTLFAFTREPLFEQSRAILPIRVFSAMVLVLALLFDGNGERMIDAYLGGANAISWREEEDKVIEILRAHGGSPDTDLTLASYPTGPVLFEEGFMRGPGTDHEFFINRCMAEFFEIDSLRIVNGK